MLSRNRKHKTVRKAPRTAKRPCHKVNCEHESWYAAAAERMSAQRVLATRH
ncbi:MAG: hypothetical protein QOF09_4596 [Alphaproteobacteria bacterium]|nr:hypothetical protein [Alphaproteobacteria bacterium]